MATIWLDDVLAYLVAQGVAGGSTGWPVYQGYIPDDQDRTIAMFITGGLAADTMARENRRANFQLRLRAEKLAFSVAYAKWKECFDTLQDAKQTTGSPLLLSGFTFLQAVMVEPLFFNDGNLRPNLTTSFRALFKAR